MESADSDSQSSHSSESHSGAEAHWAKSLFLWTCQNCTRTAPLSSFSPEMLAFAGAFGARLGAWRAIQTAKRVYQAEVAAYESLRNATRVDGDGGPVTLSEEPPAPLRPDFEAMEAELPLVSSPPAVPTDILESQVRIYPSTRTNPALMTSSLARFQVCEACDAPYISPSGSASTLIERDHVIEAMAVGLEIDAEDVARLGLGPGADVRRLHEYVSGAAPTALPEGIPAVNVDLLRATLNDDDASGYLEEAGLTAHALTALLEHASDDAPAASAAGTIVTQKRRRPALSARGGALGGFAPLVAIAYDERMLLHEEGSSDPRSGGRARAVVPGVVLPRLPANLHPERPDRLRAIAQHLVATGLFQRCRCEARRRVGRGASS